MLTPTRTFAAASLGLVVLLPAVGSAADAGPAGVEKQTVSGSIATANPTKASGTNVTRIGRTGGLVGPETNGVTGWFFRVDPATQGGEFVLTSATAGSDLDVIFYSDPGSITGASAASAEFIGSTGDGERGVVPFGTTHALIYAAGSPTTGFEYAGHAVPKVLIGTGSLDLSIPAGGAVEFVNATGALTEVTSTGTTKASQFKAPGVVPAGKSAVVAFPTKGSFGYATSVGTGTITVR